jgi:hypothetical protein
VATWIAQEGFSTRRLGARPKRSRSRLRLPGEQLCSFGRGSPIGRAASRLALRATARCAAAALTRPAAGQLSGKGLSEAALSGSNQEKRREVHCRRVVSVPHSGGARGYGPGGKFGRGRVATGSPEGTIVVPP